MAGALDVIVCKECLKVPLGATESECCHHLFCERCSTRIAKCPTCHKPFRAAPSLMMRGSIVFKCLYTLLSIHFKDHLFSISSSLQRYIQSTAYNQYSYARRLLASLSIACEHCGEQAEIGTLDEHMLHCEHRPRHCAAPECGFVSADPKMEELALHVVRQHPDKFEEKFVLPVKKVRSAGAVRRCTSRYSGASWNFYSPLYSLQLYSTVRVLYLLRNSQDFRSTGQLAIALTQFFDL